MKRDNRIRVADIVVGTQLAEADGFLWEVTEVVQRTDVGIVIRLNSDWSSCRSHWKGNKGIIKHLWNEELFEGLQPQEIKR